MLVIGILTIDGRPMHFLTTIILYIFGSKCEILLDYMKWNFRLSTFFFSKHASLWITDGVCTCPKKFCLWFKCALVYGVSAFLANALFSESVHSQLKLKRKKFKIAGKGAPKGRWYLFEVCWRTFFNSSKKKKKNIE